MAVGKQVFDERAVGARHAGVVHGKAVGQQVPQGAVLARFCLGLQHFPRRPPVPHQLGERAVGQRGVAQVARRFRRLLAGVHKDEHLVLARRVQQLGVAYLIHDLEALQGLAHRDADVLLRERARAVRVVKVEEAGVGADAQEGGDVLVVGQGGGKADDAHQLLGGLDLAHGARNDRLQHRAPAVVQQVDLGGGDG